MYQKKFSESWPGDWSDKLAAAVSGEGGCGTDRGVVGWWVRGLEQ